MGPKKRSFNPTTYSGQDFATVKSALQKYIRRGKVEEAIWCGIETLLTVEGNGRMKGTMTNFLNRIKMILHEDVSFREVDAFNCAFKALNVVCTSYPSEHLSELQTAISIASHCKKSRIGSHLWRNCILQLAESELNFEYDINLTIRALNNIGDYLSFHEAAESVFLYLVHFYRRWSEIERMKRAIWTPLWNDLKARARRISEPVFEAINHKCCFFYARPQFPDERAVLTSAVLLIVWCEYFGKNAKLLEQREERLPLKENDYHTPLNHPDFVFDKHVYRGNKTYKFFVKVGAHIENEDEEISNKIWKKRYDNYNISLDNLVIPKEKKNKTFKDDNEELLEIERQEESSERREEIDDSSPSTSFNQAFIKEMVIPKKRKLSEGAVNTLSKNDGLYKPQEIEPTNAVEMDSSQNNQTLEKMVIAKKRSISEDGVDTLSKKIKPSDGHNSDGDSKISISDDFLYRAMKSRFEPILFNHHSASCCSQQQNDYPLEPDEKITIDYEEIPTLPVSNENLNLEEPDDSLVINLEEPDDSLAIKASTSQLREENASKKEERSRSLDDKLSRQFITNDDRGDRLNEEYRPMVYYHDPYFNDGKFTKLKDPDLSRLSDWNDEDNEPLNYTPSGSTLDRPAKPNFIIPSITITRIDNKQDSQDEAVITPNDDQRNGLNREYDRLDGELIISTTPTDNQPLNEEWIIPTTRIDNQPDRVYPDFMVPNTHRLYPEFMVPNTHRFGPEFIDTHFDNEYVFNQEFINPNTKCHRDEIVPGTSTNDASRLEVNQPDIMFPLNQDRNEPILKDRLETDGELTKNVKEERMTEQNSEFKIRDCVDRELTGTVPESFNILPKQEDQDSLEYLKAVSLINHSLLNYPFPDEESQPLNLTTSNHPYYSEEAPSIGSRVDDQPSIPSYDDNSSSEVNYNANNPPQRTKMIRSNPTFNRRLLNTIPIHLEKELKLLPEEFILNATRYGTSNKSKIHVFNNFVMKHMKRDSFRYGRDQACVAILKTIFGFNTYVGERRKCYLKYDNKKETLTQTNDYQVYFIMTKIPNNPTPCTRKENLKVLRNSKQLLTKLAEILIFKSLLGLSDNCLTNILLTEKNELFSIDENFIGHHNLNSDGFSKKQNYMLKLVLNSNLFNNQDLRDCIKKIVNPSNLNIIKDKMFDYGLYSDNFPFLYDVVECNSIYFENFLDVLNM